MRRKLLSAVASFLQVQQFLNYFFIDNVKSNHLCVVWQTNDSNNTRLWSHAVSKMHVPIYPCLIISERRRNFLIFWSAQQRNRDC